MSGVQALTLYTVGHSNRSIEELIALLREAGVNTLVDVRVQPRSQRNPQFKVLNQQLPKVSQY